MRNFNSMFNTANMTRSATPFTTAGSSFATRAASSGLFSKAAGSKFTLSGILDGAQKTIGTVNQIVPLYNQVKPMFQNSKVLFNVAKGLRGTKTTSRRNSRNVVNTEPIASEESEIKKEEPKSLNKATDGPSKPFFA